MSGDKPSQSSIFSPTLHTAAIAGLEAALNKALQLDPCTQKKLQELAGHVFLLHFSSPELSLYLVPAGGEVSLRGYYDGEADTTLTGSAREFAKLAAASDPANALINGDLELHGDSNALIKLQQIARDLDLDWEAPIVDLFGDLVGHQLGQGIRQGLRFGLSALRGFKRQLDEYIVEESDLAPPRWQVEDFYHQVDQLALRTERLEARLIKLRGQIAARTSKASTPPKAQ